MLEIWLSKIINIISVFYINFVTNNVWIYKYTAIEAHIDMTGLGYAYFSNLFSGPVAELIFRNNLWS